MAKVAPREEEEFQEVMRGRYSSIYSLKWHKSWINVSKTTNSSEPFSFQKPTLEPEQMTLKLTRHSFHRGLCPGFSSTRYLPTVRR